MGIVSEIIRQEQDGSISFGNYQSKDKLKLGDFKLGEDTYGCKTHNEITRFERNSKMLLETVPGTTIHNLRLNQTSISFQAEGNGNTQFTLELEPESEYNISMDGSHSGSTKANAFGKISFGRELGLTAVSIIIERANA